MNLVERFPRAIEAGEKHEILELADLFVCGTTGLERNAAGALRCLTPEAEKGDAEAMFFIANLLVKGADGVPKDAHAAVCCFERLVAVGDAWRMLTFAVLLAEGAEGLPPDLPRAIELQQRARQDTEVRKIVGIVELMMMDDAGEDVTPAVELYEREAVSDGSHAMAGLATELLGTADGVCDGVPSTSHLLAGKDTEDALFERACPLTEGDDGASEFPAREMNESEANGGCPYSMVGIATTLLDDNDGLCKHAPRAVRMVERAVTEFNRDAMFQLATALEAGVPGVGKFPARALCLYARALQEGHTEAADRTASMVASGTLRARESAPCR